MGVATNIVRRKGSANYYFRCAYPKELQKVVGKSDYWKSLGTSDLREARRRAVKVHWEFEQTLSVIRRKSTPTAEDLESAVGAFYMRELKIDETMRLLRGTEPHFSGFATLAYPGLKEELRKHLAVGEPVLVKWAVDEIIEREGWLIGPDSLLYKKLAQRMIRAWLEALERSTERNLGDFSGAPQDPEVRKAVERGLPAGPPKARLMDVFERFAIDQRRQNSDTLDQSRKIIQRFAEFVGTDPEVTEVNKWNARDWKFSLRQWPIKANEIREFQGLTFSQVIEANKFLGKSVISEPTIAKYLSTLGSFGRWLLQHGYIDTHPTEGLLPERRRREQRRRPFSDAELEQLFQSPLFARCGGKKAEHLSGDVAIRDDRYWLFPLALLSGARLGELCQLRPEDVCEREGVRFLRLTDEGEGQSLKSAASTRDVPLHPTLIDLGFLDFVKVAQREKADRIFRRWSRNARGQFGEASKWLNAYLKRAGVKTEWMLTFHSFRHSFVDALRRTGCAEFEIKPLVGHGEMTVTRGYGREPDVPLARRAEMIGAISFPALDVLSARIQAERSESRRREES